MSEAGRIDRVGGAMTETVVRLKDVFCVHRTSQGDAAALQGLNAELRHGEILCVLGPSGAGKSTLLRVIAGFQPPSAGIVKVLGHDVGRLPSRARARLRHRELGLLGQSAELALPPDLPVRHAVELPLALRGVSGHDRAARVRALLDSAGLRDRADALPHRLSGGERQRFALCAALAHRPPLLLADEPTGELDQASASTMLSLIQELARSSDTSVIVVSHDPATARVADRTIRIRDGRVVEELHGNGSSLVVGAGGWLQIPPEVLADAGIVRRARVRPAPGGLLLTPAGDDVADREESSVTAPATDPLAHWRPSQVELRDATRGYGQGHAERRVIDGLTYAFAPGRMTVVTGRSGTGKTTLLKILSTLELPDRGEYLIDERRLDGCGREQLAAIRREWIGYMTQEPAPVGFLGAEENIVLSLRIRGWTPEAAVARARTVLSRTGLADRARQRVSRLSAGETQRVALARALAGARGLLIVDEPTSRLDEANARLVATLLAEAAARDRQTVICATHDPAVIAQADEQLALGG